MVQRASYKTNILLYSFCQYSASCFLAYFAARTSQAKKLKTLCIQISNYPSTHPPNLPTSSMATTKPKVHPIRLHFGVLNDTKVDKLRKLGLLSGPKKNLTTSLKLASVKSALLELLTNLKNSFSPTVKVLQAFVFGLPRKPLYMLSHLLQKLLLLEAFKLQLVIYTPHDFVKRGISVIGRSLRRLQRLKFLHLELEGRYEVPMNTLESFARDLNRLQGLTQLMLGLKHFKFDEQRA